MIPVGVKLGLGVEVVSRLAGRKVVLLVGCSALRKLQSVTELGCILQHVIKIINLQATLGLAYYESTCDVNCFYGFYDCRDLHVDSDI